MSEITQLEIERPMVMPQEQYREYLKTPHWLCIRRWALTLAGDKCSSCEATSGLEVHHLSYKRLWAELPPDLEVVCGPCHKNEHPEKMLPVIRLPFKDCEIEIEAGEEYRGRAVNIPHDLVELENTDGHYLEFREEMKDSEAMVGDRLFSINETIRIFKGKIVKIRPISELEMEAKAGEGFSGGF